VLGSLAAGAAGVALLPSSSCTTARSGSPHAPQTPATGAPSDGDPATPSQQPTDPLPASPPTAISIPAIALTAPVGTVGLDRNGTIETPPLSAANLAAWYVHGPAPGQLGPAVILGHVDTRHGPAVFHRLTELKAGDRIDVSRADRRTAVFHVEAVERFPKAAFPTERVYGDLDHAGLRLITCGGEFDRDRRSYRDNVVVFARYTSA
jgi:hypothetical protein